MARCGRSEAWRTQEREKAQQNEIKRAGQRRERGRYKIYKYKKKVCDSERKERKTPEGQTERNGSGCEFSLQSNLAQAKVNNQS